MADPKDTMLVEFETYLEDQGLAERSIQTYLGWMKRLLKRKNVLAVFEDENICVLTKKGIAATLRHWARFSTNNKLLEAIDSPKVTRQIKKPPEDPSRITQPLSPEESKALVRVLGRYKGKPPLWVWPCFRLCLKLGLRVRVDLLRITRSRAVASLKEGRLQIRTKRDKERSVPSDIVREELQALLALKPWSTLYELISDDEATAYRTVYRALKSLAAKAGIDPRTVYPHRLRHTAADRIYEETGDILLVRDLLGHEDVSTSGGYLRGDRINTINTALTKIWR